MDSTLDSVRRKEGIKKNEVVINGIGITVALPIDYTVEIVIKIVDKND